MEALTRNSWTRFRRGSGQGLADGKINGSSALDGRGGGAVGVGDSSVIDDACGGDLAGALAVEQVAGVDSVEQETVAGIALAIGPDRLIAEAAVDAGAARKFGVDSGGKNGESGETAGGQGDVLNLLIVEYVAVGRVDGVHQRIGLNFDDGSDLAHGQTELTVAVRSACTVMEGIF